MLRSIAAASLAILGMSTIFAQHANAATTGGTQVQTLVCDGSSSASLTIDAPQSDSVISSMPLTLSGDVSNVTQIDITIDGVYNSSVALGINQTTYSTQISFAPDTKTIELTGNDVCQVEDAVETVVVTYQPSSTPSDGGETVTTGPDIGPADPVQTPSGQPLDGSSSNLDIPIIGGLIPTAEAVAKSLDLDVSVRDGGLLVAMTRFALFALGLGLALFGASVLYLIRKLRLRDIAVTRYINGGRAVLVDPRLRDHIHRNIFLVRFLGVILLSLAFVI